MAFGIKCTKCNRVNTPEARYCGRCGTVLVITPATAASIADSERPFGNGSTPPDTALTAYPRHPTPLKPPKGFRPVAQAMNLHFRWQSAWGGSPLIGTESLVVVLFNGGHSLQDIRLSIEGLNATNQPVFTLAGQVEQLERGREITLEIPSYDVPAPASKINVVLVSGTVDVEA